MSPNPIRIAQISDLHIKPPGALAYGRVDTAKALERCVAALNEFAPMPDFVVISGDLADRPALLFLHHPPFIAGIWHMDRQNLRNAEKLTPVIRRHPRVRLIATGHFHRAALTMFAGVPTTICPAPNHAVDLDLAELREPSFKVEPPAFHLHTWFPG